MALVVFDDEIRQATSNPTSLNLILVERCLCVLFTQYSRRILATIRSSNACSYRQYHRSRSPSWTGWQSNCSPAVSLEVQSTIAFSSAATLLSSLKPGSIYQIQPTRFTCCATFYIQLTDKTSSPYGEGIRHQCACNWPKTRPLVMSWRCWQRVLDGLLQTLTSRQDVLCTENAAEHILSAWTDDISNENLLRTYLSTPDPCKVEYSCIYARLSPTFRLDTWSTPPTLHSSICKQ